MSGISIKNLSHTYVRDETRVDALHCIDLSIEAGQFVALLGASGCGKTTLLDTLSGLTEIQSGTAELAGQVPAAGRRDVARMFARDALLPWRTASANVELALARREPNAKERKKVALALLKAVGLEDFADTYPSQLSQGMRQRVALARTFSLKSRFVLLDEPFGALDALTKVTLQNLLTDLWSETTGATVVLVTHDIAESVALADRVIVMSARPGRIISDIKVQLPRPRDIRQLRNLPEFHNLVGQIWTKLEG